MSEREFTVPDLGEGLEEATVTSWLVRTGDEIELNQPLCVLETAKAEVEIPAPYAGQILECRGNPGEALAVGSLLARIGVGSGVAEASVRQTGANETGRRSAVLVGYGVDAEGDRSRRRGQVNSTPRRPVSSDRALAKPPVRKLARTLDVDLADLAPGSGHDGIVTRADVTAAAGSPPPGPAASTDTRSYAETVAVQGIRARIADRVTMSRRDIPDAHCGVEVDCGRLLELRSLLRDSAGEAGTAITPFALILRLLVEALREHPRLNASYDTDGPAVRTFSSVHLGVGTATERGLLVPAVHDAQQRSTLELVKETARLAAAARAGTAKPAELTGSTFTVSNFGALGLDEGVPVINHPEAAILGVGSVKPRPVVHEDALVARPTAALTCAFDHRVCDGAEAGAFLSRLRELIEQPELVLLKA